MSARLSIENLEVASLSGRPVLKGVSLTVARGEIVALIGESGSGKTTLSLSALGHFRKGLLVKSGRVLLDGEDILGLPPRQLLSIRSRRSAYVAQSAAASFNPAFRLMDQIIEAPVRHHTLRPDPARQRAIDLFRAFRLPEPSTIGSRYPHQVSGGQLQRFMGVMGLIEHPGLVLLDEPTSALDVTTQIEVLETFKDVVRDGERSALFVSHDLSVVAQLADRVVVLRHGEIVEEGLTTDILGRPQAAYTQELVAACRRWEHRTPAMASEPSGKLARSQDAALYARNIGVSFGYGASAVQVLHDVSVSIGKGEVLAVVGESGSGKSTFAQALAGLVPYTGELSLGKEVLAASVQRRSKAERRRVQLVFQMADTALNPRHSVAKILGRVLDFFFQMSASEKSKRITELLELVRLPSSYAGRPSSQLSGGEKQRINLARALAAKPDLIICDEITSALDTVVARSIVELVRSLQDSLGTTIIFISHDLATVSDLADRVAVMRQGHVVEIGPPSTVLHKPRHPYTQMLIASIPELRVGWLEEATAKQAHLRALADQAGDLPLSLVENIP